MKNGSVENLDFVQEVLELPDDVYIDLLDKPFELGARGPDKFDCWGLCSEVGKRVGINYPSVLTPVEKEDQDAIIKGTAEDVCERIEKPEPYCIVTFKITPPFVDHCGIVLPDLAHFLHIMRNHSVARQRLDIYRKRIYSFYRLKSDSDN